MGGLQIHKRKVDRAPHVGQAIHRGDEMGYFLFSGSDIELLFQKGVYVDIVHDGGHLLMGEAYARLKKPELK